MKKIIKLSLCYIMLIMGSCEDVNIPASKRGEPIEPVYNLSYDIIGSEITLQWDLPTIFPEDIIQPVSVQVETFKNTVNLGLSVISDNPTEFLFSSYESGQDYKFIVKIRGEVAISSPYESRLRLSPGRVIKPI